MNPGGQQSVPLAALDDEWGKGVSSAGAASIEQWMVAADAQRAVDAEGEDRARRIYWVLREHLDPQSPEGVRRILHVLQSGLHRNAAFAEVAQRAATSGDDDLRQAGLVCLGQCASVAERFDEAEKILTGVLERARGTGTRLERTVYASLAVVFQNQGREFEALILTRIVSRLSGAAKDPWELCVALQQHCGAMEALRDWKGMLPALDELEVALQAADPPWAARMWLFIHGKRAEAALQLDDAALARTSLARMEPSLAGAGGGPAWEAWRAFLRARLAWQDGQPQEALDILRPVTDGDIDLVGLLAARCNMALGNTALAMEQGRACLGELESLRGQRGGATQRLSTAANLAVLFEDNGAEAADVHRAYEVAAEAAMRRILEMARTLETLPDLADVTQADLDSLARFRKRFREQHQRLLERLTEHLAREVTTGPFSVKEGLLRVCAWCQRTAGTSELWLPFGHLLPTSPGIAITHTICPDCEERLREKI